MGNIFSITGPSLPTNYMSCSGAALQPHHCVNDCQGKLCNPVTNDNDKSCCPYRCSMATALSGQTLLSSQSDQTGQTADWSYMAKYLMLGPACSGKSKLMDSLRRGNDVKTTDRPEEQQQHYTTTVGVDFHAFNVVHGNTCIKIQLWDSSGSSRFLTIIASYFRGSHVKLLFCDLSQPPQQLLEWLTELQRSAPSAIAELQSHLCWLVADSGSVNELDNGSASGSVSGPASKSASKLEAKARLETTAEVVKQTFGIAIAGTSLIDVSKPDQFCEVVLHNSFKHLDVAQLTYHGQLLPYK